jgi:hypothetical protein
VAPAAAAAAPTITTTSSSPTTALPRTVPQEAFEDFPNGAPRLQTVGIERPFSSGFPSPGIGGPRNVKRDLGAFLANRGEA